MTLISDDRLDRLQLPNLEAVPNIAHGFSTRHGGVSKGEHASLNFSLSVGDHAANVQANRNRLLQVSGGRVLRFMQQVHGVDIVVETEEAPLDAGSPLQADGWVTNRVGVVLCVMVADCVPIILSSADGAWVGVAHAGWRGTVQGIGEKIARQMRARIGEQTPLIAGIGPSISQPHFEIGDEVVNEIMRVYPESVLRRDARSQKWHADLWMMNRLSLIRGGVLPEHIECVQRCTYADASFFSYRRDQGRTGRQVGFIVRHNDA